MSEFESDTLYFSDISPEDLVKSCGHCNNVGVLLIDFYMKRSGAFNKYCNRCLGYPNVCRKCGYRSRFNLDLRVHIDECHEETYDEVMNMFN